MLRYPAFVASLFWCLAAAGQPEKLHSFTHYGKETGLISNQVNSIVQDATGYIWIATNDGLCRFDGIRYKIFRHEEARPRSIPQGPIMQLYADHDQRLWLLAANGKTGIFDVRHFVFEEVGVKPTDSQSLKAPVKKLVADEQGNMMLLLAGEELLTLDRRLNAFTGSHGVISVNNDWKIDDIVQERGTRNFWMVVEDSGLVAYNGLTRQSSYAGDNPGNIPAIAQLRPVGDIHALFLDTRHRLWIASADGKYAYIYCYDLRRNHLVLDKLDFTSAIAGYYQVDGFHEQADGTIWAIGFKVFGRFRENEKNFELIPSGSTHEKSIDYRFLSCLCEDREHNVWIGTGNNGVFRFSPSQEFFHNIPHLSKQTGAAGDGNPLCFFRDRDGSILVGTWNDGLYRYDSSFRPLPLNIRGIAESNLLYIYDMCPSDESNRVWMASQPGLYAYNQRTRAVQYFNPPSLRDESIRQVVEDRHGDLWLGTYSSGVYQWKNQNGGWQLTKGLSRFDAISQTEIHHLSIDAKGWIWVATRTSGLYAIDPDSNRVMLHFFSGGRAEQRLLQDNVTAALPYNDSLMLIATSDQLFFYNRYLRSLISLVKANSLAGNISSVEKDDQGRLWVGTTEALYRVSPSSSVLLTFDRNDGIINDYFILASSYKLPGNRMLFGTSGNIVAFNPNQVRLTAARPNVTITGFRVTNRELSVDSLMKRRQIELGPGDNSLTIDFSTLTFNSNYIVTYQLEGLDDQMQTADPTSQLVYSYLPPGNYRLRFKTLNAEGYVNDHALTLLIKVNPPFWRTWWFFSSVFLLLVGAVYWLDRQRTASIVKEQQMRVSIASNLHEEVNTTLRSINVLSEIAAMKSGTQPEQARDYLKDIQLKSRRMVIAMNDMLWSIDPANDSMRRTIERMQEIAAEMTTGREAEIQVHNSKGSSRLGLDMRTRLELISLFKLVLELLVRKAGAKETLVQLDCERKLLVMKVISSNIRLQEDDGAIAQSLREINAKAAEMSASVHIDSDAHSTDFIIELPT